MSYFLFLDDERMPEHVYWAHLPTPDGWLIVRDYDGFVETITTYGVPEFITFDHDLGQNADGTEYNGLHCAHFLVNWCLDHHIPCPNFSVHSKNPEGAANIRNLLTRFSQFQKDEQLTLKKRRIFSTPWRRTKSEE